MDDLRVHTRVNETGFAVEIEGPSGTEFSMQFFAVGARGYFTSGGVAGNLSADGHYVHLHEVPFQALEVGLTDLVLGEAAAAVRMGAPSSEVRLPFTWSDRFEGRNIPNMPISAGEERG